MFAIKADLYEWHSEEWEDDGIECRLRKDEWEESWTGYVDDCDFEFFFTATKNIAEAMVFESKEEAWEAVDRIMSSDIALHEDGHYSWPTGDEDGSTIEYDYSRYWTLTAVDAG